MTATATRLQALTVDTIPLDDVRRLLPYLDQRSPLLWSRGGEGFVGLGAALRLEFSGATRLTDAASAWRELAAQATVDDRVGLPGTGLIAFGAFAFDDASAATSVLIVPQTVIGRRDGRSWLTRIRVTDAAGGASAPVSAALPEPVAFGPEYRITMLAGAQSAAGFSAAVAETVARIEAAAGALSKVVLSRDLRAQLPDDADLRRALDALALGYPDCWTFAVDGFLGASPETLVSVADGRVFARVLAGTAARGRDADADSAAATRLSASEKDVAEHAYAVDSVTQALAPLTGALETSGPFTLELPNLWHLATDVAGSLSHGSTSLDLVAALHPTAAVAGVPTDAALTAIRELEPFDRGRYAGPVGWIGADGSGEWAVALRSAQVDASGAITAYAGGGIVSGSDPVLELAETTMKFRPIVEAFG